MNARKVPQAGEAYDTVEIETDRGTTTCRYYEAEGARNGVVMVGGTGGGFDTPARELYSQLAQGLRNDRISALRVRYRHPADLVESTVDTIGRLFSLPAHMILAPGRPCGVDR